MRNEAVRKFEFSKIKKNRRKNYSNRIQNFIANQEDQQYYGDIR